MQKKNFCRAQTFKFLFLLQNEYSMILITLSFDPFFFPIIRSVPLEFRVGKAVQNLPTYDL